jgi:phospholipase C
MRPPTAAGKIEHVVYIVQENRSFNNLFQGYPGAYTVPSGKDSKDKATQLNRWALRISG